MLGSSSPDEVQVQTMSETRHPSRTKRQNQFTVSITSIILVLLASAVVALLRFAPAVVYKTEPFLQVTLQHKGDKSRNLSIVTPESTERKVPKLLHLIWLGKEPPAYVKEVIDFTTEVANKQGFRVKFWTDRMVHNLIAVKYRWLKPQWDAIKNTKRHDRGTRLADFARYVVIHSEGGIYLDADFVPCAELDELLGPPGYASFPWPQWPDRISNGIFSAPPGHPVLEKALQLLAKIEDIGTVQILHAAGPKFLANAVASYTGGNIKNVIKVNPREPFDSPEGWYHKPVYKLRFGSKGLLGDLGHLNWIHLGYKTWYGQESIPCEQKGNEYLIRPFLENACFPKSQAARQKNWRMCGMENNGSGLSESV